MALEQTKHINDEESGHSNFNNSGGCSKNCPPKTPKKWIIILSSKHLMAAQACLLADWPFFAVAAEYPPHLDHITVKEKVCYKL